MALTNSFKNLVQSEKGLVNRRIFVDEDIYRQELEQVFGRCWLFLGHETQVPNSNDFVAAYMGEDPMLLTRDSKGKVHAFLNMCRHRGNRICRADSGNAPSFMCTYHGWTFATDGKLVGVPGYKEAYFEELDRSQWGLIEAKVQSYKGLAFATWDRSAPQLEEYLGNMAWYLDLWADRVDGGIEVLGGIHRWSVPTNWKFYAENIGGDGYHFPITHGSAVRVNAGRSLRGATPRSANSYTPRPQLCASPGNGHGVVSVGAGREDGLSGLQEGPIREYFAAHLQEMESHLGAARAQEVKGSFGNVFPNFAYAAGAFVFKVFHPRGPTRTEVWEHCFVEKNAPPEVKNAMRLRLIQTQGPTGSVEQDDMSNFSQCTASAQGTMAKETIVNYQLGLGHERRHEVFPGSLAPSPSEANQRAFYAFWSEMMNAPNWSEVKLSPIKT